MSPPPSIKISMSLVSKDSARQDGVKPSHQNGHKVKKEQDTESSVAEGGNRQDFPLTQEKRSKDDIMTETLSLIQEMESVRDDFTLMSVRNAILLDSLTMAGADV